MLKLAFWGITGFTFWLTLWQREAVAPVAAQQPAPMLQCSPLELFNECIQERFLEADRVFGYARVTPRTHINNFYGTLSKFQPRNEDESAAVNDMRKGAWQVGFYLAGRQVLGEKPNAEAWKISQFYTVPLPPIKGPLEITGNLMTEDLPTAESLWSQSQQAMKTLARQEQFAFTAGNWSFNARPIRAREECLKCHVNDSMAKHSLLFIKDEKLHARTIKEGDVLGVALYAYRLSNPSTK